MLLGMRPLMRWRFPVLEVDYNVDRDLHLGGRGLIHGRLAQQDDGIDRDL